MQKYRNLFTNYISGVCTTERFIDKYFAMMRADRDSGELSKYSAEFDRTLSRIFTSCDAHLEGEDSSIYFSEDQLKSEVEFAKWIWFGDN